MKKNVILSLSLIMVACTSERDFVTSSFDESFPVSRNYQAVHADLVKNIRLCLGVGSFGPFVGQEMEAQLYSDLGYSEIYYYQPNVQNVPLLLIRTERAGSNSNVKIKDGYPLASVGDRVVSDVKRWAIGDDRCKAE